MAYPRNESFVPIKPSALIALLRSARPKQWTKNLVIYLALFFTVNESWNAHSLTVGLSLLGKTTIAFVIFSSLSSAIYLINDSVDINKDRKHPKKRFRPIASGQLKLPIAWGAGVILTCTGLAAALLLEPLFAVVSITYVITMVAYTLLFKQLILLDVFAISTGFVLRAVAGAVVLQVPISPWLYLCTGLGSLFIALSKRRSELALAGEMAGDQRDTLEWYSNCLLDQFAVVVATSTLLAYGLYTFTASNLPDNHSMMLTIPFVVYGLFRYMYLVHTKDRGENPEDVLISDVPLIICILLWLVTTGAILVLFRG